VYSVQVVDEPEVSKSFKLICLKIFTGNKSNKISVDQPCQFGAEVQSFKDLPCIHHQGILKAEEVSKILDFAPN
jgi:hypothetical protein